MVRTVALLAIVSLGCTSSTAPLGDVAGKMLGAAIDNAAKPYDRRKDYDYQRRVAWSRNACQTASAPTRLVVLDAETHLRPEGGVRLVRYLDCKVEWLDSCRTKSAATYRPAVYLRTEARRAQTVDVPDEIDLYERFPAFSTAFGHRMSKPTTMRVELRALTVRETGAAFGRADLDATDGCSGATHYIASIEHGALRVNFDPTAYAGESELEAQKTLAVGDYGACVREESGACESAVAITIAPLRGLTL